MVRGGELYYLQLKGTNVGSIVQIAKIIGLHCDGTVDLMDLEFMLYKNVINKTTTTTTPV